MILISNPVSGDIRLTYAILLKSIMQEYPIKRGPAVKNLKTNLVEGLKECFGVEPKTSGAISEISFGALKRLAVTIGPDGKSIHVETESDLSASDEVILDTNRRFRRYLDMVTGYTTKERVKKAKTIE